MSSYFELYGQHLDCFRDLEASLKALYGVSDMFSIPKLNAEGCRCPARVTRILRRLCRLYSLHLHAILNHWLKLDHEGLPKHEVPEHMENVDVSWWTTPVPVGHARTLPLKLKVVYVLARTLCKDIRYRDTDLLEVVADEEQNGRLADFVWNSGLKQFVHQPYDPTVVPYGRCSKDVNTLQSLPAVINHKLTWSVRLEKRQKMLQSHVKVEEEPNEDDFLVAEVGVWGDGGVLVDEDGQMVFIPEEEEDSFSEEEGGNEAVCEGEEEKPVKKKRQKSKTREVREKLDAERDYMKMAGKKRNSGGSAGGGVGGGVGMDGLIGVIEKMGRVLKAHDSESESNSDGDDDHLRQSTAQERQ